MSFPTQPPFHLVTVAPVHTIDPSYTFFIQSPPCPSPTQPRTLPSSTHSQPPPISLIPSPLSSSKPKRRPSTRRASSQSPCLAGRCPRCFVASLVIKPSSGICGTPNHHYHYPS